MLARENITVRHADVSTAMFNIETRELLLPKWTNITTDQYDLLIGHEVGHALYTDNLDLLRDLDEGLHSYINVLEDTRIERRIKEVFPGLRGAFTRGYADFVKNGPIFNDVTAEKVATMDLIDRINVHYKIGAHIAVPFTSTEQALLARIDRLRTFEETVALAKELHTAQAQQNTQKPSESEKGSKGPQGHNMAPGRGSSDQNGPEQQDPSSNETNGDTPSDPKSSDSSSPTRVPASPSAQTDVANSKALSSMTEGPNTNPETRVEQLSIGSLPDAFVDMHVESTAEFVKTMQDFLTKFGYTKDANIWYANFQQTYGPTIAHMAREFERRKTAKLLERARTARTGRIDPTKLASYKFRDDLFKSVMVVPNGKSHGIVVLLDGSGSMRDVFADVLEQTMLFAEFAKRVNIPLQAYVFHTRVWSYTERDRREHIKALYDATVQAHPMTLLPDPETHLFGILDTTLGQWAQQQTAVAALAAHHTRRSSIDEPCVPQVPNVYQLSQTPSESALLLADRLIARLKTKRSLDRMSLIVLTDGEDNTGVTYMDPMRYRSPDNRLCSTKKGYSHTRAAEHYVLRDTQTRITVPTFDYVMGEHYDMTQHSRVTEERPVARLNAIPAALVQSVQQRYGTRVIALRLLENRLVRRAAGDATSLMQPTSEFLIPESQSQPSFGPRADQHAGVNAWLNTPEVRSQITTAMSATGTGLVPLPASLSYYDLALVISSRAIDLDGDDFDDLLEAAQKKGQTLTPRKIAAAFTKSNVNQSKNRVFVNTVVPFLA